MNSMSIFQEKSRRRSSSGKPLFSKVAKALVLALAAFDAIAIIAFEMGWRL